MGLDVNSASINLQIPKYQQSRCLRQASSCPRIFEGNDISNSANISAGQLQINMGKKPISHNLGNKILPKLMLCSFLLTRVKIHLLRKKIKKEEV